MEAASVSFTFPGYQSPVKPFQPAPLYECGCLNKSIDRTPSAVSEKPISGRHVCLHDSTSGKSLVNGYNLPLSELIVPSTHDPKVPIEPEKLLEAAVSDVTQSTESYFLAHEDDMKAQIQYYLENRVRLQKLFSSVLDYKNYLKEFIRIGRMLRKECPDLEPEDFVVLRGVKKLPHDRIRQGMREQSESSRLESHKLLLEEACSDMEYEYISAATEEGKSEFRLHGALNKILVGELNSKIHSKNYLEFAGQGSGVLSRLSHWAKGGYGQFVEFIGFMPHLAADFFDTHFPYIESPASLDFILTHGVNVHFFHLLVAANFGGMDGDMHKFIIRGDVWDSLIDRFVIPSPYCLRKDIQIRDISVDSECLFEHWPLPVSPVYLSRFIELAEFSGCIQEVLNERCPERIRRLAQVCGFQDMALPAQIEALENARDDIRCLERAVVEKNWRFIRQQAKAYQFDPDDVYPVTASNPDHTYSTLSDGSYNDQTVRIDRVLHLLRKGRQVIGVQIKDDNVRGPCWLEQIEKSVSRDDLLKYKAFVAVKGPTVKFPEYIY
ncbi:hypothetical protein [Endozoicomonas arenosclerae]|uniref:hypothetical protein n=1 Tax=Endozoicomonas arenosclerae TaxID=1633495 RepID=UPI00078425D8|nr:hypothetical protein [Endozoicomonas arenosclerae]